jgi:prepilin-type processing-associated H-X9-DG protein
MNDPVNTPQGLTLESDIQKPSDDIEVLDSRTGWMDTKIIFADQTAQQVMNGETGSFYQGGFLPPYNSIVGPYQSHRGLVNVAMADGHVVSQNLYKSVYPFDHYQSGYSAADRLAIISGPVAPEYAH